jgi:hypothetical protein
LTPPVDSSTFQAAGDDARGQLYAAVTRTELGSLHFACMGRGPFPCQAPGNSPCAGANLCDRPTIGSGAMGADSFANRSPNPPSVVLERDLHFVRYHVGCAPRTARRAAARCDRLCRPHDPRPLDPLDRRPAAGLLNTRVRRAEVCGRPRRLRPPSAGQGARRARGLDSRGRRRRGRSTAARGA